MSITPLRDRVLLEIKAKETKTKGGVFLPETVSHERPVEGVVVAVGKGRPDKNGKNIPLTVKKGDKVIYSEYGGTEYELNGKKHLLIKEDEILAIQ